MVLILWLLCQPVQYIKMHDDTKMEWNNYNKKSQTCFLLFISCSYNKVHYIQFHSITELQYCEIIYVHGPNMSWFPLKWDNSEAPKFIDFKIKREIINMTCNWFFVFKFKLVVLVTHEINEKYCSTHHKDFTVKCIAMTFCNVNKARFSPMLLYSIFYQFP